MKGKLTKIFLKMIQILILIYIYLNKNDNLKNNNEIK